MTRRKKILFYRIGFIENDGDNPHCSTRPLEIYMAVEECRECFFIGEGGGHGFAGGLFSFDEVLRPPFKQKFMECKCDWALDMSSASNIDLEKRKSLILSHVKKIVERVIDVKN